MSPHGGYHRTTRVEKMLSSRAKRGTFGGVWIEQVGPSWIRRLDQCVFLGALPAFNLFLAGNSLVDVLVLFGIDERVQLISPRKGIPSSITMFGDAILKIVDDADIYHVPLYVRQNVDVVR